jgi:histidinol-phosphate aminotransferase
MDNKKLDFLRGNINSLDDKILDLLKQRAEIVTEIGEYKKSKTDVVDPEREQKVLDRLLQNSKAKYSKDSIVRIWREIFQASSRLQENNNSLINTKRSINSINIYKGGKSSVTGKVNIIKLSSNENSYGPSPRVLNYINKSKTLLNSHRYPNIDGIELREKIAITHNLDFNRIILGCGSDETLLFAALAFCQDGDEIIHAQHGFEMYSIITKIVGATSKLIEENTNYTIDVKSILKQVTPSTKIIYLANPNNPTGTYLSRTKIVALLNNLPKHIVVVLDGAYAEYVIKDDYDCGFSLTEEFENIIMTRTFSKVYGLAALRIGWCYSSEKIANILNKVKGPFNTQTISQEIAMLALEDKEYLKEVVDNNFKIKKWFEEELKKIDIICGSSEGDFSFIQTSEKKAKEISAHLTNEGIIIRQLDSYGLPNCLRITIGTEEEMMATIKSLKKITQ